MSLDMIPQLLFAILGWTAFVAISIGIPLLFTDFYLGFPSDLIARHKEQKGKLVIIDFDEYLQLAAARPKKYPLDAYIFQKTVYYDGLIDNCLYLPRKEAKKVYEFLSDAERTAKHEKQEQIAQEAMELLYSIRSNK